jgi:hypothetical protein
MLAAANSLAYNQLYAIRRLAMGVQIMTPRLRLSAVCGLLVAWMAGAAVQARPLSDDSILRGTFELDGQRSEQVQYFVMESTVLNYALDGTRTGRRTYELWLKCVPARLAGIPGDQYTCSRFVVRTGDSPGTAIPALQGWTYVLRTTATGMDEKGQVFGIDHSKFDNLVDGSGIPVPQDIAYLTYNTFIDFHSFCNAFAQRTAAGKGIQDLTRIGQTIVHDAAFSEPPVDLGGNVERGSFFKNGEITLTLKGLSLVDDVPCALVGFDSGESSFKMIMKLAPDTEIQTTGSSHYSGDIYIDLATNWPRRVVMGEYVVSQTALPFPPDKVNSVAERSVVIRNVSEAEFTENLK